jgi:hypothetical protein
VIIAIMGANLSAAAILFGVLGFLYSVFAMFARRELPATALVDETKIDLRPPPVLAYLRQVAKWLVLGLGIAVVVAVGDAVWFVFPDQWLCSALVAALLLEVVFLFAIACYVTVALMRVYPLRE